MDKKHLRHYHAPQAKPVFIAELPEARSRRNWLLLVTLPLALLSAAAVGFLVVGLVLS